MSSQNETTTWVGLIANPVSGRGRGLKNVEMLEEKLLARGVQVDRALTIEARRAMVDSAKNVPGERKILVAIGGDGTINALINDQPQVPFVSFPSGTENVYAKAMQPQLPVDGMIDWLLSAPASPMDLGEYSYTSATGEVRQRFLLMLGFGFDAAVVNRHHTRRTAKSGQARPTSRFDYVRPLAYEAWNYGFPPVKLHFTDINGNKTEQIGSTSIVFNMDCYALGLKFTPQASARDGHLDTICFSRSGSVQAGIYFATVVMGMHPRLRSVNFGKMQELKIEALESPVPVQMDGDPAGYVEPGRPWTIRCLPQACQILTKKEIESTCSS
jgi:diacylglycerol kinase (ATP)